MKLLFIIAGLFLYVSTILGQNAINFAPKLLFKEISKASNHDTARLEELRTISNTLCGKYFTVNNSLAVRYAYIGRVKACRANGCSVNNKRLVNDTEYEYFDYFILYDSSLRIQKVRVFNYEATHGQEITISGWLNQFIGYDGSYEMIVGKNIDAISGATISVYGITDDIQLRSTTIINHIKTNEYKQISGQTQGTSYKIIYKANKSVNINAEVQNVFNEIDTTFSLWNANSTVSKINRNERSISLSNLFIETLQKALTISEMTNGAFDITAQKNKPCTYKSISIENNRIYKADTTVKLDFNAIAQGLTVDLLAELFLKQGITDFLIEIGGEIRCNGTNANNESWKIGIDKPENTQHANRQIENTILELSGKSIATSGNYRNKGHIRNPATGTSSDNDMESVTVITSECYLADSYATAFMVMGYEKTIAFLEANPTIQVFIIRKTGETFTNR